MSAVGVKVAQLGHNGLRTVVTELVKQVLQVPKKLKNRTKAKKNKSLVQGAKGISEISIGSVKQWSGIINAAEFSRSCKFFHKQS